MRIALVPVKPLAHAKERLAPVLSPAERRIVSLAMLEDVLVAAGGLDAIWVLNSDEEAAAVARASGAEARPDPTPGAGLNASLDAATRSALTRGATAVLVVSADVPLATPADLEAMIARPGVAIAPDASGSGTNALWRQPADAIPAAFGQESRRAHAALARARSLPLRTVRRAGLERDIDRPEDLAAVWGARERAARTRAALASIGYAERILPPRGR